MHVLVPIIIIVIVGLQVFFFTKNLRRMRLFSRIFSDESSWRITRDPYYEQVNGVDGRGNVIFDEIVSSINKYLQANAGSVIDFGLLKDAVDRHCDSIENEIANQTPVPLYCGLAGTMAGVIIGLLDLLSSGAISTLLGSGGGVIADAAGGIDSLLSGVAWAMLASICGIILTTCNSVLFKSRKLEEEAGKNSFLAWMQAELLPKLPTDISEAMKNMVSHLNDFNDTFSEKVLKLDKALERVNAVFDTEARVFEALNELDIVKVSRANVYVWNELQNSTDRLKEFNEYLEGINGYTETIHRFETLFNAQAERLHVLEEIRDFFGRYKGEIARTTADADNALKEALERITEGTTSNVSKLHAQFEKQSNDFKSILSDEKTVFEDIIRKLQVQFESQIKQMPELTSRLGEISRIPGHLNKLIEKVEASNKSLASDLSTAIKQVASRGVPVVTEDGKTVMSSGNDASTGMRWMGWVAVILLAMSCGLSAYNTYMQVDRESKQTTETARDNNSTETDLVSADPIVVENVSP